MKNNVKFNEVTFSNGIMVVNTTPHLIRFIEENGNIVEVQPSDIIINADVVDESVYENEELKLVTPTFLPTTGGKQDIELINKELPGALIIGSIIAAQAYPKQVVAMVPHPDFVRVPPAEKKMLTNRFTIY